MAHFWLFTVTCLVIQRSSSSFFRVTVKLDTVGSCCTLIAEELLKDTDFHLDDQVAQLLYGKLQYCKTIYFCVQFYERKF